MKPFFCDIFEYQHQVNQQTCGLFEEKKEAISETTLKLLSHSMNAHHIWNARILKASSKYDVFEIHDAQTCADIDSTNYSDSIKIIADFEPEERISYMNTQGESYQNSVREILFHIINHTAHHRGQIMAELRATGMEPLKTDYIFFRRI